MSLRKASSKSRINLATASDQMLLEMTREGITPAFGELWSRHNGSVIAAARAFTGYDPNDLMQEAFLRVYSHIQDGGALPISFRAYVATIARRLAVDKSRKAKGIVHDPFDEEADFHSLSEADFSERVLENSTTGQAFKALGTRYREVLWYRDVEDLPVQEIARYIGMTPNSTTALIKRAREAFKTAWITTQLSPRRNLPGECVEIVPKLVTYSRGRSSPSDTDKIELHLLDCTHCSALVSHASELHKRLALVLLPLLLLGSAPTYMTWIQSGQNRTPAPAAANWVNISFTGVRHPRFLSAMRLPSRRLGLPLALAAATATLVIFGTGAVAALRTSAPDTLTTAQSTPVLDENADESTDTDPTPPAVREAEPRETGPVNDSEHPYDLTGSTPADAVSGAPLPLNAGEATTAPTPNVPSSGTPGDGVTPVDSAITYPEYRPISTVVPPNYSNLLTIQGTPGATITINIFDKWGYEAGVVVLPANAVTGTVEYNFPNHRGTVVTLQITQDYASANGIIRDPLAHKLTDFSISGG